MSRRYADDEAEALIAIAEWERDAPDRDADDHAAARYEDTYWGSHE